MTVSNVVSLTALLALSTAVFAQSPRRDGRWEVSMQMEMPGMPAMAPFKSEQCVTKEQANDPQSAVPPQGANSDCKSENTKTTGNKVTWSMRCTTPDADDGHRRNHLHWTMPSTGRDEDEHGPRRAAHGDDDEDDRQAARGLRRNRTRSTFCVLRSPFYVELHERL